MAKTKHPGDDSDTSRKVRELLQPVPINRAKFPKWLFTNVKAAIKAKQMPPSDIPLLSAAAALDHISRTFGHSWADHSGIIHFDGYDLLAADPYAANVNRESLEELESFTKTIGARYLISSNSYHFPGRTLRIVIAENQKILDAYRKSDHAAMELLS